MLTDIFANRYSKITFWQSVTERECRLLVQSFRIFAEDVCPYWQNGQENPNSKEFWTDIHSRLSRELGLKSLSELTYYLQRPGGAYPISGTWSMDHVCETWVLQDYDGSSSADRFIKERLSFIEIGFRRQGEIVAAENAHLPQKIAQWDKRTNRPGIRVPGNMADGLRAANANINQQFKSAIDELNARIPSG